MARTVTTMGSGGNAITGDIGIGLEIAGGYLDGISAIHKFGSYPDIGTAYQDIWDGGGQYTVPSQARVHDVESDNAADAGTLVSSGTATDGSLSTLEDSGATFQTDGVVAGDLLLNDTNTELSFIASVPSETELVLLGTMRDPFDGFTGEPNEADDIYRVVRNAGSGGASVMVIDGLDASLLPQREFVLLAGATPVATALSYRRQFRARVFSTEIDVTTRLGAAGKITSTAQTDGTVTCQIDDGNNQTLMAIYTIPVGKTGYLFSWQASLTKKVAAVAELKLRTGSLERFGYITDEGALNSQGASLNRDYSTPIQLGPGLDIWVEAAADLASGVGVESSFDIILVDE